LLGRLHDTGFTHRDLKPTNLLFDPEGRAYLIDLEGLRTTQEVTDAQAVGDLSKLARRMIELATLSPSDAATFLKSYCSFRGRHDRRWWWREIRARMIPYMEEELSR
jgi:3-deoxy-D-manno-octulosonic acid kinase